MMPEDKLGDLMARGAKVLDAVPPMADDVLRRIRQIRAEGRASRMSYRIPLGERIFLMSRVQKIAAAVLLALLLAATGWAAEKVVRSVIEGRPVQVKVESAPEPIITAASAEGSTVTVTRVGTTSLTTESSGGTGVRTFTPEQRKELDTLVAGGKYDLISKSETPLGTAYRYRFVFSDGVAKEQTFFLPLEQVKSLADYLQKQQEYEAKRQEAMQKALVKGHYRLVNVEPLVVHVCVDVATGKTIHVQQVNVPDGVQMALAREVKPPVQSPGGGWEETLYETTWQEHLDSIKAGRRKLLDAEMTKCFWYEMTLEDGSKTILGIGGTVPLKEVEAPSQSVQPAVAPGE